MQQDYGQSGLRFDHILSFIWLNKIIQPFRGVTGTPKKAPGSKQGQTTHKGTET